MLVDCRDNELTEDGHIPHRVELHIGKNVGSCPLEFWKPESEAGKYREYVSPVIWFGHLNPELRLWEIGAYDTCECRCGKLRHRVELEFEDGASLRGIVLSKSATAARRMAKKIPDFVAEFGEPPYSVKLLDRNESDGFIDAGWPWNFVNFEESGGPDFFDDSGGIVFGDGEELRARIGTNAPFITGDPAIFRALSERKVTPRP